MDAEALCTEMEQAIQKQGLQKNISTPAILQKCAAFCTKYQQSVGDILDRLESFIINNNIVDNLTFGNLGLFEQALMKDLQKSNKGGILKELNTPKKIPDTGSSLGKRSTPGEYKTPSQVPPTKTANSQGSAQHTTQQSSSQHTPVAAAGSQANFQATISSQLALSSSKLSEHISSVSYHDRLNRGEHVLKFNEQLGERGPFESCATASVLGARCKLRCDDGDHENVSQRYRFMFTTLEERARALDRHLLKLQEQMCQVVGITEDDLQPVGVPSQDMVWVCGRICCEAAEGRINKSSVLLEGSRRLSQGRRVQLDLQEVPSFALFPGQVVLVQGVNSSGRKMTAKRIMEGVPRPKLTSSASQLLEYHHSEHYQRGAPLHVVTAAGPFTTADSLDYQPLQDLLVEILGKKPDVVVLVGPFVDITQPLLATGDVMLEDNIDGEEEEEQDEGEDEGSEGVDQNEKKMKKAKPMHQASYEMVFVEKIVRDCLQAMFNSEDDFGCLPTKFVLVPSLLDAHHEFVFPQPPFGDRDRVETEFFKEPLGVLEVPFSRPTDLKRRVYLLSNPCMFRVNELLFGVCSNDTLFSLSSDETSANLGVNRLARLSGHMLLQQSFSPQFPAPSSALAQYDMRHARHWEFKTQPDVLLVPSRMAPLCKDICGCLVLNPGHLTRGTGGGTYAHMHIHPIKEDTLKEASITARTSNQPDQVPHNVSGRANVSIVRI